MMAEVGSMAIRQQQLYPIIGFMIAMLFVWSTPTHATRVQPMSADITPIGKGAQLTMRVDNTSSKTQTMEIVPALIEVAADGSETWIEDTDDLLVVPVTAIVPPGRSQTVMVRYIGEPTIKSSRSYRVSFKQVPVSLSNSGQKGVGIQLNFNTLINVIPHRTEAEVAVRSITRDDDQHWRVEVENTGQRYARLTKTTWSISDGKGNQQQIDGASLHTKGQSNLLLPHTRRVIRVPSVPDMAVSGATIQISTRY